MDIIIFSSESDSDSEDMYKDWLKKNRNGFVVNFLKSAKAEGSKSDARFTRIHRASCKSINPLESNLDKAGFTTSQYQKACAITLEDAEKEGRAQTGLEFIKCCPCVARPIVMTIKNRP
ncbi:hypothetical protein ABQG65_22560 [Yersinia alsatica]|uniref:hypothetical protein n=1 Tax=Yersinia alsatica TaxID=2890317 RepID=UPI0032F08A18